MQNKYFVMPFGLTYSPAAFQAPVNKVVKGRHIPIHLPGCRVPGSVSFLGIIVSEGNIQIDPAKVRAVSEWPTP